MTLLDAPHYDPSRARLRTIKIVGAIIVVLVLATVVWFNRYWQEKRIAGKFFSALQTKDFETAYGIYFADPQWKQHPTQHAQYPYYEFYRDWGPGGEWGVINNYEIFWMGNCPTSGSGVIADVVVNKRAEHAQIYVDKHDRTISSVPCDIQVH
jgi:hypothetical protein